MSRSVSARRQGLRKKDAQVQLFPFLAVLICTMGALIVLLVVLVQQAKAQAAQMAEARRAADAKASHTVQEQLQEKETYEWRLEILKAQEEDISRQLADERLRLSHVEDHHRRLRDELQALVNQAAELERVVQGGAADAEAAQTELARLQQSIALARTQLDEAVQQANTQPQSFALIPYEGPNGTHRRPIYIECLIDRVVLQPEGVTLTERDFEGPLGPGNPLDAALRATREYLARTGGVARHGEPYPLLVVRASGARSYAAARAGLESWDDEFGYELVDDELSLHFPPVDPVLKAAMQEAVEEARRRQAILRAAQPNRYAARSAGGFHATPRRGGFQAIGEGEHGDGGEGASDGEGLGGEESRGEFRSADAGADGQAGEADASGRGDSSSGGKPHAGGAQGGRHNVGDTIGANTSFAVSRGRNWGLKGASESATPYTRPITVQCFADKLVLAPERGSSQAPVTIPMTGSTRLAIDPFMQALWKRIEGWGLAGSRAYWKPIVKVEVAADAEDRFTDFQQLLDESGLVIERKTQ